MHRSCDTGRIFKYICLTFTVVLLWGMVSYNASASSAQVSIQSSEKQIVKGDIVYVIITVSSSETMSGFEGYFSYDSRVLQYVTGGNVTNGNDDKFQISDTGRESGVSTLKYSVKFVARKTGTTSIELKRPCAVYSAEDSSKMSVSSDTLNIMVRKSEKDTGMTDIKETEKPENENQYPQDTSMPQNTEMPRESQDVAQPEDTLKPSATKPSATKAPANNKNNKKSDNTETKKTSKSVTATYQNSITTIHFYDEYTVTEVEDKKIIPTGFGKTEIVLNGHVITAYATESDIDHTYVLIYCKRGRHQPQFYLYDTENDSFMPYDKVKSWYKGAVGNAVVGSDSMYETKIKTMKYIVGIMVIICLLMLIGMLTIYLHYRENNNIIDMHEDFYDNGKTDITVNDEPAEVHEKAVDNEFLYKETFENENPQEEITVEEEHDKVAHYWKRD